MSFDSMSFASLFLGIHVSIPCAFRSVAERPSEGFTLQGLPAMELLERLGRRVRVPPSWAHAQGGCSVTHSCRPALSLAQDKKALLACARPLSSRLVGKLRALSTGYEPCATRLVTSKKLLRLR